MARSALVTGSRERVSEVTAALERSGFEVTGVDDADRLTQVCADLGSESLDCYVQLPVDATASGANAVERVRNFLAQGLLARFDAAAAVISCLRPGSSVVLVTGHQPGTETLPDDQRARIALLRVLGHAIIAELASTKVTATVVDSSRSADDIAAAALPGDGAPLRTIASFADHEPGMSWDEWRRDIMALTSMEI